MGGVGERGWGVSYPSAVMKFVPDLQILHADRIRHAGVGPVSHSMNRHRMHVCEVSETCWMTIVDL